MRSACRRGWFGLIVLVCGAGFALSAEAQVPCSQYFDEVMSDARAPIPEVVRSGTCVERDRLIINGRKYIFLDLVGYRSEAAAARWVDLAKDATYRAVTLYNTWFTVPDALLISGVIEGYSDNGDVAETGGNLAGCVIYVDDSARHAGWEGESDGGSFKRTVAHELFHCVQYFDPTVEHVYVPWRDEGTAEYFGGLAVPEAQPKGYEMLGQIESTPLYTIDGHGAYPFIAFLGNERGTDAVVWLLKNAVRGGSDADSRQTLHSLGGIEELFQQFARRFLWGELVDESGRPLTAYSYNPPVAEEITTETTIEFDEVKPFTVPVRRFHFERGVKWVINAPEPNEVRGGIRDLARNEWRDLRATLDECREHQTVMVLTSTKDSGTQFDVAVIVKEEPLRQGACPCPVGSWTMSSQALKASQFASMIPDAELLSGSMTLTFTLDGHASATFNDITFEAMIEPQSEGAIRARLNGSVNWTYERKPYSAAELGRAPTGAPEGENVDTFALERNLVDTNASWTTEFLSRGSVVGSSSNPFQRDQSGGGSMISAAYCVGGSELHLFSGQASVFGGTMRSGPPWTGVFRR